MIVAELELFRILTMDPTRVRGLAFPLFPPPLPWGDGIFIGPEAEFGLAGLFF